MPRAWAAGDPSGLDGEMGILDVAATINIGAAGAPTLVNSTGYFSIARSSAGVYVLAFLPGGIKELRHCGVEVQHVAATTGGVWGSVTVNNAAATSSPGITFTTWAAGAMTPTDPANGNVITVRLKLKLW